MPATLTVSTLAQLYSALATASSGQTILLEGGNYGDLYLGSGSGFDITFPTNVTIKSASATNPAVFSSANVIGAANLTFDGISFDYTFEAGDRVSTAPFIFSNSDNITIRNSTFDGDSSLRGREVWVAMTSRPDLLAIDMKRQGRFGVSLPLFPAQGPDDVITLFKVIAGVRKIALTEEVITFAREKLGTRALTGSDVEAVVTRAKESAVLAGRDNDVKLEDFTGAVDSFIDPLDPQLLRLQEYAAILSCSDSRFLPEKYRTLDRAELATEFERLKRTR